MPTDINFSKYSYNSTGEQAEIIIDQSKRFTISIMSDSGVKYILEYKISNDDNATWRRDNNLTNLQENNTLDTFANIAAVRLNIIALPSGVVDVELVKWG